MENSKMTPWNRIDQELAALKRDWKWLSQELGLSEQAVNHWEARGVPPKHYPGIDDALGKPRGWAMEGTGDQTQPLSEMAQNLADLYDLIPKTNVRARARAFNLACEAIRREIPDADATD